MPIVPDRKNIAGTVSIALASDKALVFFPRYVGGTNTARARDVVLLRMLPPYVAEHTIIATCFATLSAASGAGVPRNCA